MRKIFSISIIFTLFIASSFLSFAHAADIRSGNTLTITSDEKDLRDLYLFGNSINVEAPVRNDLVAAGRDIIIETHVSGNIFAAAGNLRIRGDSDGSARVMGGNVVIDGHVGRDLLVAGGAVIITKTATIAGDLIVAGGEITIQGDVGGRAIINGGQVRLEGKIAKQVEANAGKLTLGPRVVIGGDIVYSSPEKATIEKGAVIKGSQRYTRTENAENAQRQVGDFFKVFSLYKLLGDIVLSVLFILFFGKFIQVGIERIMNAPFRNFMGGFAFLLLVPLISIILLALLLLGIASFLFYFLVLILALYLAKIFIGWLLLAWWYKRSGRTYILDWKSGVVGPIVLFIIALIPILGWLFIAILYLISIGAFIQQLAVAVQTQRTGFRTRK